MEGLPVSNSLQIHSYQGPYSVQFIEEGTFYFDEDLYQDTHLIIDKKLIDLYSHQLQKFLALPSVLIIEALETNKSLEKMPEYVAHLVKNKCRRQHKLLAIGGGIIQDITCFLAANLLRGIEWWFIPTTLLAQADSCIGSKSSINCGEIKNILGTFTPPQKIMIDLNFLKTLSSEDLCSGIGEMLKVHAIESPTSFDRIAREYKVLFKDAQCMTHYIHRSLEIKKNIIEQDEFDRDVRHVMNYGHTFGHAIESATTYQIPHGIAVSIGMDMANFIAMALNMTSQAHYERMSPILRQNYRSHKNTEIPFERFLQAISKDKKNVNSESVSLILPDHSGRPGKVIVPLNDRFKSLCNEFLMEVRSCTIPHTDLCV